MSVCHGGGGQTCFINISCLHFQMYRYSWHYISHSMLGHSKIHQKKINVMSWSLIFNFMNREMHGIKKCLKSIFILCKGAKIFYKHCYVSFRLWCHLDINQRSLILALLTLTLWPPRRIKPGLPFHHSPCLFTALQLFPSSITVIMASCPVSNHVSGCQKEYHPFLTSNWPLLYLNQGYRTFWNHTEHYHPVQVLNPWLGLVVRCSTNWVVLVVPGIQHLLDCLVHSIVISSRWT